MICKNCNEQCTESLKQCQWCGHSHDEPIEKNSVIPRTVTIMIRDRFPGGVERTATVTPEPSSDDVVTFAMFLAQKAMEAISATIDEYAKEDSDES